MTGILNIQFKPTLDKKEINLKKVEYYIQKNSDKNLDLVVLPEFFSTGISTYAFENRPEDINGGDTIKFIQNLAKEYKTNIVAGTVIEKENNKLYNTSFVINRDGKVVDKYRKIHLFNYMGGMEGTRITSGDRFVTVDLDFGRVAIAICFDIRYPIQFKELAKSGAELIVLPTAWIVSDDVYNDKTMLKEAQNVWIAMNRTRAFDNLVYMVSCNQCGNNCIGNSLIISPSAAILSNAKENQGGFYADIDLSQVKMYKSVYPISHID